MPDRDQHVDRLLREAMAGPVRAESADCLDIETLAAWSEGSLDSGARGRAETHAATCTRCQGMLAAMIRTEPMVAPASPSSFRKWLVMLGPALGAAAAVALWFAVDRPGQNRSPVTTTTRVEDAARAARAASAPAQEERKLRDEPSAAEPQAVKPNAAPNAAPIDTLRREREADRLSADADRPAGAAALTKKNDGAARKAKEAPNASPVMAPRADTAESPRVVGALPLPPPPPAAPEPPRAPPRQTVDQIASQNAAASSQAAPAERRANETVAPRPPATVTEVNQPAREALQDAKATGQAAGRGGRIQGYLSTDARALSPSTLDVPSSTPLIRYRVVNGRTIQRSTDGGTTWTTGRLVAPPAVVVAGASPSPMVCWLAATGGVVLTTGDGVIWREVKVSEPGEIKTIVAVDATTATVTMTDGRTLTTTNGGTSWARPR